MAQTILPNEILLNILYHLDGDQDTITSFARTSKLFRQLLLENEPRVAFEIAQNHVPGPIRFLLESTAPTTKRPSFAWLDRGYARGHAVELLVNALENSGLYRDQSIFGSIFSIQGRPLVPADYADVRRYVTTMLLAVELCSLNDQRWERQTWIRNGPRWVAGFILLSEDLIRHAVKMLHLCIKTRNEDTVMTGTPEAWELSLISETKVKRLTRFLCQGMLISGARGIVDILSTTYDSYDQFVAVARYRIWAHVMRPVEFEQVWPHQRMPLRWDTLGWVSVRSRADKEKHFRSHEEGFAYVIDNAIDEWKKDIPDDKAWAHFMYTKEWFRPLEFEPAELRKRTLQAFLVNSKPRASSLWDIGEYLRNPLLAQ